LDAILPAEFRAGNILEQSGREFDPVEIMDYCNTQAFLFNKRVVIIENCPLLKGSKKDSSADSKSKKENDSTTQFLKWIQDSVASDSSFCMIFTHYEESDKKNALSKVQKLYKVIEKVGFIFPYFQLPTEFFGFINQSAEMRQSESLLSFHKLMGEDIEPSKISYMLMGFIRRRIKENLETASGIKDINLVRRQVNHYLQTLEIENRLRPRDQDLFSEDPQYVIEQWIMEYAGRK
jgi:hypothetical protein